MSDSKKALEEALKLEQEAALALKQQQAELEAMQTDMKQVLSNNIPQTPEQTLDTPSPEQPGAEPISQIANDGLNKPQPNQPSPQIANDDLNKPQQKAAAAPQPSQSQVVNDSLNKAQPKRARRPDMQMTKDEQDMQSQIIAAPQTKKIADKLTAFKEKTPLSPKQERGITELFKIVPENPKPSPAEKKEFKTKYDEIVTKYDLDKLDKKQQKELEKILGPEPEINPNLPKPKFSDEQQKKFDKFMTDKGLDNKAPEVKQLYVQAFQAILINEFLNKNDDVDKDLEVQFQEIEKILFGTDTPIEAQQVGVTDSEFELLDRYCATDGFESFAEKVEEQIEQAKKDKQDVLSDQKEAGMDAVLDVREAEVAEENSNTPGMRF